MQKKLKGKSEISKKKVFAPTLNTNSDVEPTSFTKVAKLPKWQKAMCDECEALMK